MTLVQLAAAVGVSTRSLSGHEAGRQQPSPRTLGTLAREPAGAWPRRRCRTCCTCALTPRPSWATWSCTLLHELGLLTDWGYRTACVNLSRLGYRSSEPGGIPHESSQLLT